MDGEHEMDGLMDGQTGAWGIGMLLLLLLMLVVVVLLSWSTG